MADIPDTLIDEHIALLAEARRERDHHKQNEADYAKALSDEQALNAELLAALKNEMAEERRRYQNSPKAVAFFEKNNAEALALIARAEKQQ